MESPLLRMVAFAVLLFGSTAVSAAPKEPPAYAFAIIIGGGRTEADAKKAIGEFRGADWAKVTPADGYPKILSSSDVDGAPPNTYMAVLGYCPAPESQALVKKMVHAISTGAYSMPVAGKYDNACPTLAPELQKTQPQDDEIEAQPKKKRRK